MDYDDDDANNDVNNKGREGVVVVMMTDVDNDMEKAGLQWPTQGLMEPYFFGQSIHIFLPFFPAAF